MFRRIDCQKYWRWKRQQEQKSKKAKKKVKKRKRKESVTDCIDVEPSEALDTALKVRRPKIKKKKKDTSWLSRPFIKCVPLAELVLRCIKPPIEIREQFLNPRHINCLHLDSMKIDIVPPEILRATTSLLGETQEADQIKDRKKCKTAASRLREKSSRKESEGKAIVDSDSEEEDCKSICSTDSEVCLQGIKITSKDKEELKKYRTQKDSTKETE